MVLLTLQERVLTSDRHEYRSLHAVKTPTTDAETLVIPERRRPRRGTWPIEPKPSREHRLSLADRCTGGSGEHRPEMDLKDHSKLLMHHEVWVIQPPPS